MRGTDDLTAGSSATGVFTLSGSITGNPKTGMSTFKGESICSRCQTGQTASGASRRWNFTLDSRPMHQVKRSRFSRNPNFVYGSPKYSTWYCTSPLALLPSH